MNLIINQINLVDQGREFYKKFMQEWLESNNILMYSTHSGGKSVIETLKGIQTLKGL